MLFQLYHTVLIEVASTYPFWTWKEKRLKLLGLWNHPVKIMWEPYLRQLPYKWKFSSVQFSCSSHVQLFANWCSTPGLSVHHQLPEFTQTHVHWVDDAIQPSDTLSSPSSATFNFSQHQGLFKWISSSQQVAKILELQLQHKSFQLIFRTDLL